MTKTRRQREQAVIAAAREVAVGGDTDDGMVEVKWDEMIVLRDALHALDTLSEPATPRAARCAPVTSHAAARFVASEAPSLQARIIQDLWNSAYRNTGLTVAELEYRLGRKHETVSARVNELANAGWIRDSGHTRKTDTGRQAVVWMLTAAGEQAIIVARALHYGMHR